MEEQIGVLLNASVSVAAIRSMIVRTCESDELWFLVCGAGAWDCSPPATARTAAGRQIITPRV